MSLSERIKKIRIEAGLSQEKLSEKSGVGLRTITTIESGDSNPRFETIKSIAEALGIEIHELTGNIWADGIGFVGDKITPADPEHIKVPRYEVKAGMGPGFDIKSEQIVDHLVFKRDWIKSKGLDPNKLALIEGIGDSMEPILRSKDIILLDLRPNIRRDGVYALNISGEGLVVKLVQWTADKIIVKSKNSEFLPMEIERGREDKLRIVGRVVWFGREM